MRQLHYSIANKFNIKANPTKMDENMSALKRHFLASIVPHQQSKQSEHFLKNKEFYKPQQFIWNNPHRTSKRLYPYYHQFNQQYETKVQPVIQNLKEQDRIAFEQDRIKRLMQFRNQTRQKFFERQKSREQLQAKSNSRRKTTSIAESESRTNREYTNSNQKSSDLKKSFFRAHSNSNHITMNIQKTFQKGVHNYDVNLQKIKKIINQQVIKNHSKIRTQFQKRKENNDSLNNSISHIKGRKSVGVLKYDNYLQD